MCFSNESLQNMNNYTKLVIKLFSIWAEYKYSYFFYWLGYYFNGTENYPLLSYNTYMFKYKYFVQGLVIKIHEKQ